LASNTDLWPFILFLPKDKTRRHKFIKSIIASSVAQNIFSHFNEDGRVLQRDLIENLPHSNKSIIAYLKSLEEFQLSNSGTTIHNGKRVVYHELTKIGWGLARFFSKGLPLDISELTGFLLEDYLTHIITLYREQGIAESEIYDVFTRTSGKVILGGSPHFDKPDYMIFGASTYSTVFECVKYHSSDDIASCKLPSRFPGGPTAELATTLSGQGFKVSFVSSVGDDQDGWNIISDLIQQNIDVTGIVVVDDKHTNETIIVDYATRKQTLIGIDEMFALSITSPSQVPWDKLANAKAIYIGEVFVEVALAISAYAKSRQIPVIYRCSVPFLEMGISKLEPLLNQVDVLILSNQAWRFLKQDKEKEALSEISSMTNATIIVRTQRDSYQIIQSETKPIQKKTKARTDDISPWFSLGLLDGIVDGSNIESAIDLGIQMEEEKHKSI